MKRYLGTEMIEEEDQLRATFDAAPEVFKLVQDKEKEGIRWSFDVAYVDWEEGTASFRFTSHNTPEYEGYTLSISAKRTSVGLWEVWVNGKIKGEQAVVEF